MTTCTFAAHQQRRTDRALGAGDWIGLAATPTFAVIALMTGLFDGSPHDAFCATTQDAVALSGMTVMYVLMAVFHTTPWLRLIARWRGEP